MTILMLAVPSWEGLGEIVWKRGQSSQRVGGVAFYAAGDEADSIARRTAGHIDFDGGDWTLDLAALPLGSGRSVRESGGENFLHHLRILDHDSTVERVGAKLDDSSAQVLCAKGLPNPACGHRVHGAGVCHLLGAVALVPHGSG